MPNLSDTIARLGAFRKTALDLGVRSEESRLKNIENFGSNPGALRGCVYIPQTLAVPAPLVVVLHGCMQSSARYDRGAGWSEMADRHGFALLFPEQTQQNNPNLCFNWFAPEDSRRGSGEACSIRQMIDFVVRSYPIHSARVYVTGLSAGGAMASVMLATYPEVFAGGAIIAGLPYGSASTIPQAFDRMRGRGLPGETELAALVRTASKHAGRWPTVSIWHGCGDSTVNPTNADAIIQQWRALHSVPAQPSRVETVDGYPRRVWLDDEGREVIEDFRIAGMGHGTPLDTVRKDACGKSGAYMLEAGISSTHHICQFWSLSGALREPEEAAVGQEQALQERLPRSTPRQADFVHSPRVHPKKPPAKARKEAGNIGKIIEDALRAAGLM